MKNKRDRTFLSYASEDLETVRSIYAELTERKIDVWFDKEHLKPGPWKPQIMKAISRSRFFVICLSDATLIKTGDETPGFQDKELNRAYEIAMDQPDDEFAIVPARIEECGRGDQDCRLTSYQQYDLFDNIDKGLDRLAVALGGVSLSDRLTEDTRTEDQLIVDKLMGKAATLFHAGAYNRASDMFTSITMIEPNDSLAWYNKGIVQGTLKRYEKALIALDKAIELDDSDSMTWFQKGNMFGMLKQYPKALRAFEKAIQLEPHYAEAWHHKGIILGSLEQYEKALDAIDIAIKIHPDDDSAWYDRGNILGSLKRYDEALISFHKATQIRPNNADAWFKMGNVLANLEQYKKAVGAYDKAIQLGLDEADEARHNRQLAFKLLKK